MYAIISARMVYNSCTKLVQHSAGRTESLQMKEACRGGITRMQRRDKDDRPQIALHVIDLPLSPAAMKQSFLLLVRLQFQCLRVHNSICLKGFGPY